MAEHARVTIYSNQIAALFGAGGEAHRETVKVMRTAKSYAISYAPVRSGELKASHHTETRRIGRYETRGTLSNDAEHAEYVSGGTTYPITADGNGMMILRPGPNHPLRTAAWVVNGQQPNNWMERAVDTAIAPYL